MGRNKTLNYADFGNTGGQAQGNNRVSNGNRGNNNGVFNRLGNNTNAFQPLADTAAVPGRIAFGGKANSHQQRGGSAQAPQQHQNSQLGFTQNRNQQQGNRSNAQGNARNQQSGSHSVQKTISDGIRDMNRNWPLTCYAAVTDKTAELRNAPNEVTGDVSFEEVRWADYQERNKQTCMARFTAACQAKHMQFQALQHSQAAPSQGGAAIPEPQSPYIDVSQTAQAAAMHQMPIALATPAQPAQNPFGQTKNPFGKAQTPLGQASNPFGGNAAASAQPFVQAVVQQQAQQSGRIRFGQKAKGMSQQNLAQNPFQSASQPTGDPFGRPRPAQAMQPAQQNGMPVQAQNPFGQLQQQQPQQQQLPPGTPAPFAAFNGAHNLQNQSGFGAATAAGFETPAAQRPAFGGGVAASLQTPAEGAGPLPNAGAACAAPDFPAAKAGPDQQGSQSNAWAAEEFEVGQIPEEPPPHVYCQA